MKLLFRNYSFTVTRHNMNTNQKKKTLHPLSQGAAAKKLGVTREHLNRVLRGHRQSRRLMAAWKQLTAA